MRKILLAADPFDPPVTGHGHRSCWPAQWISDQQREDNQPRVVAFRAEFSITAPRVIRMHVSADERYELFLDGQRVGRGPERGDERNWYFETYEAEIPPGTHRVVARVWRLGCIESWPPGAQHGQRLGFVLAATGEGITPELLNTGRCAWQVKRLVGYEWRHHGDAWGAGARVRIRGERYDWGHEAGAGGGWLPVVAVLTASSGRSLTEGMPYWWLRPAELPAPFDAAATSLSARHVEALEQIENPSQVPIRSTASIPQEQSAWNRLLRDAVESAVVIAPHTSRRVLIDCGTYVCAYPHLVVSGGAGGCIRLFWAESLVECLPVGAMWSGLLPKGDRSQIEGKFFWGYPLGVGDEFLPEGGDRRAFSTLWWECGRYIDMTIATGTQALTIHSLQLVETHFPHRFECRFDASDPRLPAIVPMMLRSIEMCSHETFMDCPYFEQLQYVGDTRLQALVSYVTTRDRRLARKAIELFDASRETGGPRDGMTNSRYPSRDFQSIPPFSLWWVGMVHDYLMWQDDADFIARCLPGVRAVTACYARHVTPDGLLGPVPGWNFVDWADGWANGMPPGADVGVSSILCWQYAWTLRLAAEIEDHVGEPELAALQRRRAATLASATVARFWDDQRGLMADDLAHRHFSEHAQCLALLSGVAPAAMQARMAAGLVQGSDLTRTTIYFSHYLFDAAYHVGHSELILDRMPLWFDHLTRGLHTTIEMPEPTRSDCHAWGSHPMYHFNASLLGVRPESACFRTVRIEPRLGPLQWARGTTCHPHGLIETDVRRVDGHLTGWVTLPEACTGIFVDGDREVPLHGGRQDIYRT